MIMLSHRGSGIRVVGESCISAVIEMMQNIFTPILTFPHRGGRDKRNGNYAQL